MRSTVYINERPDEHCVKYLEKKNFSFSREPKKYRKFRKGVNFQSHPQKYFRTLCYIRDNRNDGTLTMLHG